MHDAYYQNTLYPLQDKILETVGKLPVGFYLTGGTALSRAYLYHRYSDDLDFFVNNAPDFKNQVNLIFKALNEAGHAIEVSVADDGFARVFIVEGETVLKLDFVNDVPFRSGNIISTSLFHKTDNLHNILSNKITSLGRLEAKDLVDIVFICNNLSFNWETIMKDASEKDLWVNPVHVIEVIEQFPFERLQEINWIKETPSLDWFDEQIKQMIPDILDGSANSLFE
ncbi:MAG: nucleotidyl transferase AbiEii/AbiGii toxin family protein [Bacteroidales bacterium]|jgi:hypothetical protein|nr:nucleotidyl transferase AbiEii/AbiGii toxin family protein [Bacteroidales bacterium]